MTTKNKVKTVPRSIRLSTELWEAVRKASEKESRSLNWQMIKIVRDWLKDNGYL